MLSESCGIAMWISWKEVCATSCEDMAIWKRENEVDSAKSTGGRFRSSSSREPTRVSAATHSIPISSV